MNIRSEILRHMGHSGETNEQLDALISSCTEKLLPMCSPRHVLMQFPCTVDRDCVRIDTLTIKSPDLAAHLCNCTQVFMFAATLGSAVDRFVAQRVKIDSAEALCLEACATVQIEAYCNSIEEGLSRSIGKSGLLIRPRFSPGYGNFDIAHQTDLLRMLDAHKHAGISETKAHMLTPLKSVTAVIGLADCEARTRINASKCDDCNMKDCQFRHGRRINYD